MIVEFKQGTLLETNARALFVPVACDGVWPHTINLENAYPTAFRELKRRIEVRSIKRASLYIVSTIDLSGVRQLVFAPILETLKSPITRVGIELCLVNLIERLTTWLPESIGIPLNLLRWSSTEEPVSLVYPYAERLDNLGTNVYLHSPDPIPSPPLEVP